jgi:hypothetical protein
MLYIIYVRLEQIRVRPLRMHSSFFMEASARLVNVVLEGEEAICISSIISGLWLCFLDPGREASHVRISKSKLW